MKVTDQQVEAGQSVYSRRTLNVYDFVVLGISNRLIWRCPTPQLVKHYNQNITANHLDVGVGTGYFLDNCQLPTPPRIALMDLNQNSLVYAAQRIARYHPELYQVNVLEPILIAADKFDSVGVNYLLHCVPGTIETKSVLFDHLQALMNPGAVIFGSTLLHAGISRNWFARRLMRFYNSKGIFSNRQDSLEGLTRALDQRFTDISIQAIGSAAVFSARV